MRQRPCTSPQRTPGALLGAWLPVALWAALIYLLSAQPVVPHPGRAAGLSDALVDYSAHAALFGALALLVWRALGVGGFQRALTAGGLAALYGALDELHQTFVPGRYATLPDWLADAAGILAALGLALAWRAWRSARRPASARAR